MSIHRISGHEAHILKGLIGDGTTPISGDQMAKILTQAKTAEGGALDPVMTQELVKLLKGKTLSADARTAFYQAAGVLPPGEEPPTPPITALYAVRIRAAMATGDTAQMLALHAYAKDALEQAGGTEEPLRPMALSASTMSANSMAASMGHPVREVRAAFHELDAHLHEIGALS
jgi:hypothetical protein